MIVDIILTIVAAILGYYTGEALAGDFKEISGIFFAIFFFIWEILYFFHLLEYPYVSVIVYLIVTIIFMIKDFHVPPALERDLSL